VAAAIKFVCLDSMKLSAGNFFIALSLIIVLCGFIFNYKSDRLLVDIFLSHTSLLLFLPLIILMTSTNANIKQTVLLVFSIIFWVDSVVMTVELLDKFVGYDIHKTTFFNWVFKFQDPARYFEFLTQSRGIYNENFYAILPNIIGLRGYPNYTAPLFTASFLILLSVKYSKNSQSLTPPHARFLFFLFGSVLVFALGVKSHMVTLTIGIILIGVLLNRLMLKHLVYGFIILSILVIFTEAGTERLSILYEQLFIGGMTDSLTDSKRIFEPGRFATIFSLESFSSLLDLTIQDLMFGASQFSVLDQWDMFFENRILIVALVLGLPYITIFLIMAIRAIRLSLKSYKLTHSPRDKGLYVGIFLAVLVLLLETGHSGYTFDYPNVQIFVFLIAASFVLFREVINNRDKQNSNQY